MLTMDKVLDNAYMKAVMNGSDHPGAKLERPIKTRDGKFVDTTGAFLVGELERLDQTLHEPLSSISWDRDLPQRTDVTVGDEVSSFTQSTFGTPAGPGTGSVTGQKRSFISKVTTEIPEMALDIDKTTLPLVPWGEGIAYSLPELASAAQLGRPIDQQKIIALNRDYQLQLDAQAYLGWSNNNTVGLINATVANGGQVSVTNLPLSNPAAGASSTNTSNWSGGQKTAQQILQDLANMTFIPWQASGYAVRPNRILLDPLNFTFISVTPATQAGSKSIMAYFLESYNSDTGAEPLRILPLKWLTGAGVGGTLLAANSINRAVVYNRFEGPWQNAYVRFPTLMLQRTPLQYDGLWHKLYYWSRMGACEFIYPETVALFDGL
jgi:hypothetical protein